MLGPRMPAKPNFPTFIGNSPEIDTINQIVPLQALVVTPSALWCCPALQLPQFSLQIDFFNIKRENVD